MKSETPRTLALALSIREKVAALPEKMTKESAGEFIGEVTNQLIKAHQCIEIELKNAYEQMAECNAHLNEKCGGVAEPANVPS